MLPKPWLSVARPCFETESLLHWSSSYARGFSGPEKTRGQPNCPPWPRPDMEQLKPMPAQPQTGFLTTRVPQHGVQPPGAPPCPSTGGCPAVAEAAPASHTAGSTGPGTQGGPKTSSHMYPAVGSSRQGGTRRLRPKQANLKRCGFAPATGQCSCHWLHGSRE